MILAIALALSLIMNLILLIILFRVISDYMDIAHSIQRLHNQALMEKNRLEDELVNLKKRKK